MWKAISETEAEKEEIPRNILPSSKIDEIPYESFAEFYKTFNPKSEQDKSLIAVYWLNKKLGKEKVTPKDVSNLLREASIPLPSDIARDMRILSGAKKAYLIKLSKTTKGKSPEYKISITGENYINSRLQKEKKV